MSWDLLVFAKRLLGAAKNCVTRLRYRRPAISSTSAARQRRSPDVRL